MDHLLLQQFAPRRRKYWCAHRLANIFPAGRYYGYYYRSPGYVATRGTIDRNFALSDGSVKTVYKIINQSLNVTDPRLARMSFTPVTPAANITEFVYLPPD